MGAQSYQPNGNGAVKSPLASQERELNASENIFLFYPNIIGN